MKHTSGPWDYARADSDTKIITVCVVGDFVVGSDHNDTSTDEADARLIAEAGTVATETGLTPRQLADQRNELLEALRTLVQMTGNIGQIEEYLNGPARAAIAKATTP